MEEQPRKLESVIHVSQACIPSQEGPAKENYQEQAQDLVFNENILLQTLGFDVAVDHPHTHVVRTCQLVKGTNFPYPIICCFQSIDIATGYWILITLGSVYLGSL